MLKLDLNLAVNHAPAPRMIPQFRRWQHRLLTVDKGLLLYPRTRYLSQETANLARNSSTVWAPFIASEEYICLIDNPGLMIHEENPLTPCT